MSGAVAEVGDGSSWQRCSGRSNDVGRSNKYVFQCGGKQGNKVRVVKDNGWITISELEVLGSLATANQPAQAANDPSGVTVTAATASGSDWIQVDRGLKHVSVSDDGSVIWGVNRNDDIYYRNGPT